MNNMKNVMEHILQILCRNFRTMFQKSRKNSSKFFLKDNCPILNCAKVQKSVNPLSPDINMHILHTVLHMFRMIALGRIC